MSSFLSLALLLASLPFVTSEETIAATYSGSYSGTYSGAYQIVTSGTQGSPAVPATCPAQYPDSCASIGATDWCCASGNTCAWENGQVGCCPSGQTCNGYGAAQTTNTWNTWAQATTTSWQPTTTWQAQPSTVVVPPPAGVVTVTQPYQGQPATTTARAAGGFCSTVYEKGPGLPTQAAGECGTILVAEAGATRLGNGLGMGFAIAVGIVAGQALSWFMLT